MKTITDPLRVVLATLPMWGLVIPACQPPNPQKTALPPAYTSNQITDPALYQIAQEIQTWASQRMDADGKLLYSRAEVLPPVPIVQPYGVGIFQQEVRLPVILTTGPGWAGMEHAAKEAAVVEAFHHITGQLKGLDHEPTLQPTLTVQTSQGIELTWINHLDPSGRHVHGDD